MRLIEGIRSKIFPVAPYLLQDGRVVSILLATLDELGLHGIYDFYLFLTHGLTQGITLTTGEVGQLSRKKHHLLLVNGDSVGIFQIFLHTGDGIGNLFPSVLTVDELRNILHRPWTIEGIHGYQVFEHSRFEFTQIFLHAIRLKLESTNRTSLLIEFKSLGVVNRNMIQIDLNTSCLLDNSTSLFHLRQRLQSQEVHLNQSCRFYHVSVILRTVGFLILEIGIIGRADRHPVTNRVATDNESTGMNTRSANGSLQHLGIFDGIAQRLIVAALCLTQFRNSLDGIYQIHLRRFSIHIGQTVGDCLTQGIRHRNGHFLNACHVLDGVLGCHRGIGDDMGTVLMTIFILHPLQHLTASVVVEIGIDIRQRDTVRIQETLEKQIVFQRVNLGNTEAIGYHGACCRTTSRTHHHAQFVAGRIDKVLHDEEVTRETHRLHDMQFKTDAVIDFLCQRVAIQTLCTLIC